MHKAPLARLALVVLLFAACTTASGSAPAATADVSPWTDCYPFDQPSPDELRASGKKVFAWYFPPYPMSIDNQDPGSDYYARWLDPAGGNGEYADTGGHLRDRPLSRPVRPEQNWRQLDFEREIRQAIAVGLDGFMMEMSYQQQHPDNRWNQVRAMLDAAQAVDPAFRIMLSPGFPKDANATPDQLADTLLAVAGHPSVYRLEDGRMPIATFYPERPAEDGGKPLSWWRQLREQMSAQGVDIAWYPAFLSTTSRDDIPNLDEWYAEMAGYTIFDAKTVGQTPSNSNEKQNADQHGVTWIARANLQDMRVRKGDYVELRHWESSNSATLRGFWEHAIAGDADWLTMITWNDYGETQNAPSQGRGYAVSDLVAYYTTWFKTGVQPTVQRDALYYFHRNQHSAAPYDTSRQTAGGFTIPAGPAAEDNVELVAFLTASGQVAIIQGDDTHVTDIDTPGLVSVKAPIVPGMTPRFELRRGGEVVQTLDSATPVRDQVVYQDMTYYAGGGLTCDRPG